MGQGPPLCSWEAHLQTPSLWLLAGCLSFSPDGSPCSALSVPHHGSWLPQRKEGVVVPLGHSIPPGWEQSAERWEPSVTPYCYQNSLLRRKCQAGTGDLSPKPPDGFRRSGSTHWTGMTVLWIPRTSHTLV